MIYLASPYSHELPEVMHNRFLSTELVTATLLANNFFIYSPIVHCHVLSQKFNLPTSFSFWQTYNQDLIRCAEELWVLSLPGWSASVGVTGEIAFAQELNKPVRYIPNGSYHPDSGIDAQIKANQK